MLNKANRDDSFSFWKQVNSEGPVEMPQKVAFISLHRDRYTSFYKQFDQQLLKIQNGQFHIYCILMFGIIHQNEKG